MVVATPASEVARPASRKPSPRSTPLSAFATRSAGPRPRTSAEFIGAAAALKTAAAARAIRIAPRGVSAVDDATAKEMAASALRDPTQAPSAVTLGHLTAPPRKPLGSLPPAAGPGFVAADARSSPVAIAVASADASVRRPLDVGKATAELQTDGVEGRVPLVAAHPTVGRDVAQPSA